MGILRTVSYISPLCVHFMLLVDNKVLLYNRRREIQIIITCLFSQGNGTRGNQKIRNSGCAPLYNIFVLQMVMVLTRLTVILFLGINIETNHLTEAFQFQKISENISVNSYYC
jgi:hypothetical protein